jgi:hypothetical protein
LGKKAFRKCRQKYKIPDAQVKRKRDLEHVDTTRMMCVHETLRY